MSKQNKPKAVDLSVAETYRIGEAARMIGISPETLRVWEKQGLARSKRTSGGYRLYTPNEIARLAEIYGLRKRGINIAGIASILPRHKLTAKAKPNKSLPTATNFGRALRQLRISGGLSLAAVSTRAGLSASFISLVERDAATPSIESMKSLCQALGANLSELLGKRTRLGNREFISKRGRQRMPSMDKGIRIERLAGPTGVNFDPRLFVMRPGKNSGGAYAHEGVEFIFVLKGQIHITIDLVDSYTLAPGDSLYFDSTRPHDWSVIGDVPLEALWIDLRSAEH